MSYFHMRIHTIIGAASFHDSVRDGKKWFQSAIFTKQSLKREKICKLAKKYNYRIKPHGQLVSIS